MKLLGVLAVESTKKRRKDKQRQSKSGPKAGHGQAGQQLSRRSGAAAWTAGLREPRRKTKLTYAERHQLADRIIAQMMADGWVGMPASVKEMRRMLIADPLPMAPSMGLSAHDVIAPEPQQNAYAVAVDGVMAAPDGATALLCNAVAGSIQANNADSMWLPPPWLPRRFPRKPP
jgi:hypothetical protein